MNNRGFVEAIGYVARNEEMWVRMINDCYKEWAQECRDRSEYKFPMMDQVKFKEEMLQKYGIDCFFGDQGTWDFHVVDEKKYSFFQIKYTV